MTDELILAPNVEALVSLFLRETAELAELLGGPDPDDVRVFNALPADVVFPAMRLVLFDTIPLTRRPQWLFEFRLQLDAWGGSSADAWRILATAGAAMSQRMIGEHPAHEAVVTGVELEGGRNLPDASYTPAKPRRLVTAIVRAHPLL